MQRIFNPLNLFMPRRRPRLTRRVIQRTVDMSSVARNERIGVRGL